MIVGSVFSLRLGMAQAMVIRRPAAAADFADFFVARSSPVIAIALVACSIADFPRSGFDPVTGTVVVVRFAAVAGSADFVVTIGFVYFSGRNSADYCLSFAAASAEAALVLVSFSVAQSSFLLLPDFAWPLRRPASV